MTRIAVAASLWCVLAAPAAPLPAAEDGPVPRPADVFAAEVVTEPWPSPLADHRPVQPGEHPRLIFRKHEVPAIRARAATPEGRVIVARLRRLLGGGEQMPTHYNENPTVNTGAKGPGQLPLDSYTLWHGAGFGLLYQLTGEQKYADLGRQCTDKALEGVPDRDERYSFTDPGGQLRAGPSVRAVALAYDLCYDGWPPDYRQRVAKAIQDYGQDARADSDGTITLAKLVKTPRHHPQSNHYGMQVGGGLVALLAIRGDPGTDPAKIQPLIEAGKANLKKSLLEGHGSRGYYPEGHHTGRMTANGILPAMHALMKVEGEDWVSHAMPARWLTSKWVYEVVRQNGRLDTVMRDRYAYNGFARKGMHGRDFAQGFGIMPAAHRPAALWFYNHVVAPGGVDKRDYDVTDYPHAAAYALATWPFDLDEQHPAEVFPKVWLDPKCAYFLFRNGWSGQADTDIVVTAHMGGGRYGAYGAGRGGPTMVMGLGHRAALPGGFRQSSCSYLRTADDGSALLSSIRIYTHLAVDFSGASGAEALIVHLGRGAGVTDWGGEGAKTHDRTGATLKTTKVRAGGLEYWVTTLSSGEPPTPTAEADTVVVGDQVVGYNGQHLTLKVMGEGPPAYDPDTPYYRDHIGKPIPPRKLLEEPSDEEKRAAAFAAAEQRLKDGNVKRAEKDLLRIVEAAPDSDEAAAAKPLLRQIEWRRIEALHAAKKYKEVEKAAQFFIGKHQGTDEAKQAEQMLKDMETALWLETP